MCFWKRRRGSVPSIRTAHARRSPPRVAGRENPGKNGGSDSVVDKSAASSRGLLSNTGNGPNLQVLNIRHRRYAALVDPDTAFWALIPKAKLGSALGGRGLEGYLRRRPGFLREMEALRFGVSPAAVYFNPTERCNLDCSYCYLPGAMRRTGVHMPPERLFEALGLLKTHFRSRAPKGPKPQIIFHGSEPLLAKEAIFSGIDRFSEDFRFGIQTNGVLLDDEAIQFIRSHGIGLGLSLDGATAGVADRTRKTWSGRGVFPKVVRTLESGDPRRNRVSVSFAAFDGALRRGPMPTAFTPWAEIVAR